MLAALRGLALLLLAGAAQTLAGGVWWPLGAFDLLMATCGMLALRSSWGGAVLAGSAAGFVQDSLAGGLLGLHALSKTAVCAVINSLSNVMVVRGPLAESTLIGLAAIGEGLLARMVLAAVGWPGSESTAFTLTRGLATAAFAGTLLIGRPAVVLWWQRRRSRSRLRIR